jgi:phosphoenolpyruvate-protein kinase (PTS system EI component)
VKSRFQSLPFKRNLQRYTEDAALARDNGAEGIGLVRTEHMVGL